LEIEMHVQQSSLKVIAPEEWLRMGLSPAALDLLRDGISSSEYAKTLIGRAHFEDTVRVIAYALPTAVAVKWVLSCIHKECSASLAGAGHAVGAIEAWLADPTDASRRTAFAAAEAIGLGTPVGCLGLAVFLSGGSMAPASAPEVPAPPGLAGRSITGALMMSAVSQDPQNAPKKIRLFAESGTAILTELSSAKSPVDTKSPQPQF
jgi:hypothetical protein